VIGPADIRNAVERALAEDLASGDLTTESTVSPETRGVAQAVARTSLCVCGGEVFQDVFAALDPDLVVERVLAEGAMAEPQDVIWRVSGSARSILMGERTALNFVQRMCGIATLTREYVRAIPPGFAPRITDTRKTTPGLRALERYAVRTGGAYNHRANLGSAVLIKDNHIAVAGGVRAAVERARHRAPHTSRVEIEVKTFDELDEALAARADIIMLDNFAPPDIASAVLRVGGRALVEVSGGVRIERIAELARAGVDVISVGALTHSAPASDISLELGIVA
jgi:nicotinate-nucleotide pyrophosphorylase (carboxylating)